MGIIFEMFSGYAFTAGVIVIFFWPILVLLENLTRVYLRWSSQGIIDIKPFPFLSGSRFAEDFGCDEMATVFAVIFYICLYVTGLVFTGSWLLGGVTFHEVMTLMLTSLYTVGVWLSGFSLLALVLVGVHYVIRYTSQLSVKAANALKAVKQHESNYHKGDK